MNSINLLITLLLFISHIICIDIKLSLMKKKDKDNIFPVVMTLKDNESEENKKNIDFLCIVEYNLLENYGEHTKVIIDSILRHLKKEDGFTLITHTKGDGINQLNNNIIDRYINSKENLKHFFLNLQNNEIEYYYNKSNIAIDKSDFIKIIFFFSGNNSEQYYNDILQKDTEYLNDFKSNYSLYFLSFDYNYPYKFSNFSDSRNIDYLFIDKDIQTNESNKQILEKYVIKIIENNRNIKYKSNNITITSKYEITKFYGKDLKILDPNKKQIYSFTKYQFIPGVEYTYFFEVKLSEDIKYGDRILYVKINYTMLNGETNNISSSSLKFYNAINYFKIKKYEFCRARLTEGLELYLFEDNKYDNIIKLYEIVNIINDDFCGKNFSYNYLNITEIKNNSGVKDPNDIIKNIKFNYILINKALRYCW